MNIQCRASGFFPGRDGFLFPAFLLGLGYFAAILQAKPGWIGTFGDFIVYF